MNLEGQDGDGYVLSPSPGPQRLRPLVGGWAAVALSTRHRSLPQNTLSQSSRTHKRDKGERDEKGGV